MRRDNKGQTTTNNSIKHKKKITAGRLIYYFVLFAIMVVFSLKNAASKVDVSLVFVSFREVPFIIVMIILIFLGALPVYLLAEIEKASLKKKIRELEGSIKKDSKLKEKLLKEPKK